MPVQRYRKLPVVIEAIEYDGTNALDIISFAPGKARIQGRDKRLVLLTLEGIMKVSLDDFVIKGVQGEFYPCKPDIFWKTYERAE